MSPSNILFIKRRGQRHHALITALEYVFMFIVLLEFNSVLLEIKGAGIFLSILAFVVILILCILRKHYVRFDSIVFILLLGSVLPLLNVYPGSELSFVRIFVILLPLFLCYQKACKRENIFTLFNILLKFSNLVYFFAIVSLFYWIFATNLGVIKPTMMVPNDWGEFKFVPTYHFLYYEMQTCAFMGYSTIRNSGMFEEGPMYNMVLCTSLLIELFLRTPYSKRRIIVLCITIITTFTTTGFIFLMTITLYIYYRKTSGKNILLKVLMVSSVLFVIYETSTFIIEDKLSSTEGSGEGSFNSRTQDIEECIAIGMNNPFLGQGLFTKRLQQEDGGTYGFSNSLFTLFADGGIYTVSLYVMIFFLLPIWTLRKTRNTKWPFVLLFYFMLFTITISQYKLLTLWLLSFGLAMYWRDVPVSRNNE